MDVIDCWTLSNRARLVVEEIPYVKSAAIGVYIKIGSRHEPENIAGASHFIEHMLFKGTEKRSAREIAESFEKIGGQLNAFTSKEFTCVYARTLDENIYEAVDIIFDMLFKSKFSLREFATEKEVIMEEINMYEDTPDDLIHDLFARKLWCTHPIGSPILGTLETVSGFEQEEIFSFYKAKYTPQNMVISIAGNVDRIKIRDLVESYLQEEANQKEDYYPEKSIDYYPFINLVEKDTEQEQICLGVPGISYNDPDRYTMKVMDSILGGGMSSRLFQTIREELGLAYSVYSYPTNYSDTGSYSIYVGTGHNKVASFFEALFKEIEKFVQKGVSDEELLRSKHLIKSNIYLSMEGVMNRMNRWGKSILMYDEITPVEKIIDRILAVDRDMVRNLAANLLEEQSFSLAAIGPAGVLTEIEQEYKRWWG